MMEMKAHVAC